MELWLPDGRVLINGKLATSVGLGTWPPHELDPESRKDALRFQRSIEVALELGCPIFGAQRYWWRKIDQLIGEVALTYPMAVLTSKLYRPALHSPEAIRVAVAQMAEDFGRPVDLALIHWPWDINLEMVLPVLCELVRAGELGGVGVSNFPLPLLEQSIAVVRACGGTLAAQELLCFPHYGGGRIHPNEGLEQPNFGEGMERRCDDAHILKVGYSPLGKGWQQSSLGLQVMGEPALARIARRREMTVPQVILTSRLRRRIMPIPASLNPQNIRENVDAVALVERLTDQDLVQIAGLERPWLELVSSH